MPAPLQLDDALTEVFTHLGSFVPERQPLVPENSIQIVSAQGRNLALGNRRGNEQRFGVAVAALRGLHLDATLRIELWDDSVDAIEATMGSIHANLLDAHENLRALGFLKFAVAGNTPAENVGAAGAWRKTSDLKLLYEYQTSQSDDTDSFIVRIPLRSDLEEGNSPAGTLEVLTDDMRRWDEEGAASLIVRGGIGAAATRLTGLATFDFRPGGFAGDGVTIERGVAGAAGPPTDFATLDDFLDAIGDGPAPVLNARIGFANLTDFLNAVGPAGDTFELGDWNEDIVRDVYTPRTRSFPRPVTLASGRDFFAIRYQSPAFTSAAVLYLRLHADHSKSG